MENQPNYTGMGEDLDIPEAVRETSDESSTKPTVTRGLLGAAFLLGVGVILLAATFSLQQTISSRPKVVPAPPTPEPVPIPTPTPSPIVVPENILGHLPYEEVPSSELVAVTPDGKILLRKAAAEKFKQMSAAARREGVNLHLISGFRSVDDQNYLFFKIKEQRAQNTTQRAEVSAPPGFSEHHTGYAVDIGDSNVPATHLETTFEKTAAFRWLSKNAAKYSFELSFPKDNAQGISYEPWHWRFVGDSHSLATFYKAKNLTESLQK